MFKKKAKTVMLFLPYYLFRPVNCQGIRLKKKGEILHIHENVSLSHT